MTAVREQYTNIVGVDTHARTNTYAILVAATGQITDTATFPTRVPGLTRAIAWIDRRSDPGKTLVAIEGTNSYGSGLTRFLRSTELDLCEVRPPRRGLACRSRKIGRYRRPLRQPARCSEDRLRPCWNPAPGLTGRYYGSCSTPGTPWRVKTRSTG